MSANLVQEIDKFLKATNMAESTFGRKAINDGKLVTRLREGGQVLPTTEQRIREFINSIQ